jgi:hypothetical protein
MKLFYLFIMIGLVAAVLGVITAFIIDFFMS